MGGGDLSFDVTENDDNADEVTQEGSQNLVVDTESSDATQGESSNENVGAVETDSQNKTEKEESSEVVDLNEMSSDELFAYISNLSSDELDSLYDKYPNLNDLISKLSKDQQNQILEKFGTSDEDVNLIDETGNDATESYNKISQNSFNNGNYEITRDGTYTISGNIETSNKIIVNTEGEVTFVVQSNITFTSTNVSDAFFTVNKASKVTVNATDYSITCSSGTLVNVASDSSASIELNGGTYKNSGLSDSYGLVAKNSVVSNCSFENFRSAISVRKNGSVTLKQKIIFNNNTSDIYLGENATFNMQDYYYWYTDTSFKVEVEENLTDDTSITITNGEVNSSYYTRYVSSTNDKYSVNYNSTNKSIYLWKHTHNWKYKLGANEGTTAGSDMPGITAYCDDLDCIYSEGDGKYNLCASLYWAEDSNYTTKSYDSNKIHFYNPITEITGAKASEYYYEGRDGTSYTKSTTSPTDIGKYTVYVELGGITTSADFEIKNTIEPTSETLTITKGGTYNLQSGNYKGKHSPIIINTTEEVTLNIQGDITCTALESDSQLAPSTNRIDDFIQVKNTGNLTINAKKSDGSNYTITNGIHIFGDAKLTLNGGAYGDTIEMSSSCEKELTLNDCTFEKKTDDGWVNVAAKYIIANNCTFKDVQRAIYVDKNGYVKITGKNTDFSNISGEDIYLANNSTFELADELVSKDDFEVKVNVGALGDNEIRQITKNNVSKNLLKRVKAAFNEYEINYDETNEYLTIWKHSHTWSYSSDNDKDIITAKCTSTDDCIYSKGLTATFNDTKDLIYNGEPCNIVVNNISKVTGAECSVTYVGRDETTYDESSTAPTNAGKYTAKMIVDKQTISKDFEILKCKLHSIVTPDSITAIYGSEYSAMGLPEKVSLNLEGSDNVIEADVTWNIENLKSGSYDPSKTTEQNVTLEGKVTLPANIDQNNVSLTTTIDITIMARPEIIWHDQDRNGEISNGDIVDVGTEQFYVTGSSEASIDLFALKGLTVTDGKAGKQSDNPSYVKMADGKWALYTWSSARQYVEQYVDIIKSEYGLQITGSGLANKWSLGVNAAKDYQYISNDKPCYNSGSGRRYWTHNTNSSYECNFYVSGQYVIMAYANSTTAEIRPALTISRTQVKLIQSITVDTTMNGWTYGSDDNSPSISDTSNPGNGEVTYTYYTNEDCTNKTTSEDGATEEGGKPTNVGTYYVKTTVEKTDSYTAGSSVTEFTISKATPTVDVKDISNLTYNGTKQNLVTGTTTGGTLYYQVNNGEWTTDVPTAKDAGTYTVKYKVDGGNNYNDVEEQSVDVIVAQKTVKVSGIAASNKEYDGTTNVTIDCSKAKFDGIVVGDSLTVSTTGTFNSQNAGNQTVTLNDLTLGGNDVKNYVLDTKESQKETNAQISPKSITGTITPNGGTYGNTITPASVKLNGLVCEDNPTVTLKYNGSTEVPTNAGKYTVVATIEDKNYSLSETSAEFVIHKANPNLSVSAVSDKTYGDKEFNLEVTKFGSGALFYASSNKNVVTVDATGKVTIIGAGEAKLTVTVAVDSNYLSSSATVDVKVKKADGELKVSKLTYNKIYGDEPFSIGATSETGTVSYKSNNSNVVTVDSNGLVSIVGVGEATICVDAASNDNYDGVSKTVSVVVNPKSVTVTAISISKTYGDSDPKLTYTIDGVDKLNGISVSRKSGDDVGKYKINVSVDESANPNYSIKVVDGTFTIEPKSISNATVILGNGLVYSGSEQTQEVTNVEVDGLKVDTYSVSGNKATKSGSYTLTVTGTGNFIGTKEVSYVVATSADNMKETTDGKIEVGKGSASIEVKGDASLETSKAELIEMLIQNGSISAEQLKALYEGSNLNVSLNVNDVSSSLGESVKTEMKKASANLGLTISNQFLDISLYLNDTAISSTSGKVKASIVVPDNLINTDSNLKRTYYIVRYHEGEDVACLEGEFNEKTHSFTFETDRFSAYALAYKDAVKKTEGQKETKVDYGKGTIVLDSSSVNNDLVDALIKSGDITSEELEKVKSGSNLNISLKVTDVSSSVSSETKSLIEETAKKSGYTMGNQYYDVQLYKDAKAMSSTSGKVSATVSVPNDMMNTDSNINRTYYVVGNGTSIECSYDKDNKTVTFETNTFGSYVLAYKDVVKKTEDQKETKVDYGKGTIVLDSSSVNNDLVDALINSGDITSEELEKVKAGATLNVSLKVTDVSSSVSSETKSLIEETAKKLGYTIGDKYLNINLYKDAKMITTTSGKVKVSVSVPDNLINSNGNVKRTYYAIGHCDGKAVTIEGVFDEKTQSFTFETNQFSTYVIAYKDTTVTTTNKGEQNIDSKKKDTEKSANTGVQSYIELYVCLFVVAMLGIVLLIKRRKSEQ